MRKKLCFNCRDPWVLGHRCLGKGQIHYIEVASYNEEEEINSTSDSGSVEEHTHDERHLGKGCLGKGCSDNREMHGLPVGASVEGELHQSWMRMFPSPFMPFVFISLLFLQESS
jgi:hypothetical protein